LADGFGEGRGNFRSDQPEVRQKGRSVAEGYGSWVNHQLPAKTKNQERGGELLGDVRRASLVVLLSKRTLGYVKRKIAWHEIAKTKGKGRWLIRLERKKAKSISYGLKRG